MIANYNLSRDIYDICIVGGGASGIAAAIRAKQLKPDTSLIILEKNTSLARKIRATGNGKCNITNTNASEYGTMSKFLTSIGIITRIYSDGLVYPFSESAKDVVEMLNFNISKYGIETLISSTVIDVTKDRSSKFFNIDILTNCDDGRKIENTIHAKNLIISTGGKAAPMFGTTGDGYRFARNFGHRVIKTIPILSGIECYGEAFRYLQGVRAKGRISLYKHKEMVFYEDGEIQFTKYGISGIAVFNMTRMMRLSGDCSFKDFRIVIDLSPGIDMFSALESKAKDGLTAEGILTTITKPEISRYIIEKSGINDDKIGLNREELKCISNLLHNLTFTPINIRKWSEAQCTSGGVDLSELDEFYQSRVEKGLFFTGEVVDYDGPCGGYNLTHAFVSGIHAATGAIANIDEEI